MQLVMKRKGWIWFVVACLLGTVALAGCGGDDGDGGGGGGGPKSIKVGFAVKNDIGNAPLVIADEQGIYADYGLDAELVYFDGGGALVQAMAGGQVDYGWVSHAPVIKAIEGGAPIRVIGEVSKTAIGWGLVAPPDSPIKSPEDLEPGVKISYTSEGALTHWYGLYVGTQAGLKPDDVEGAPIGTSLPTIKTALEKGQVDAATVLLPWGDVLVNEGDARWVSHMDKDLPEFSFTGIPATETAIEDEQTTSCFLGAYTAAVRWMAEHPRETQKFMERFYSVDPELAKSAYDRLVPDFNETGEMDPERMQFVIDEMKSVPGFIEGSVSSEDVLDQANAASQQECAGKG
jgi:ABC-type nitrate/sulfonate/bicarbonate transport system substrate-binding protein